MEMRRGSARAGLVTGVEWRYVARVHVLYTGCVSATASVDRQRQYAVTPRLEARKPEQVVFND